VPTTPREDGWRTRWGVILAVAGSAVGLGNLLRFPGQVVANGGGAFMLPYFCAFVFLGIPIAWVEWTMARRGGLRGRHSAVGILGLIAGNRVGRYFGALAVLVPAAIYMYYVLIEAWCLRYAWAYLSGGIDFGVDVPERVRQAREFFVRVSGSAEHGAVIAEGSAGIGFWLVVLTFNLLLVHRGLSRGIEAFCRWAFPLMVVCASVVLVRVLTLGTPDPAQPHLNVLNGLGYLWNPDLSRLGDASVWLAAAAQIFFSLSVGFGIIINYASYMRAEDDVVLSALSASALNEFFEVTFGGLITVTAAFVFLGASGALGGTFALGFTSLPAVFAQLGSWERPIGAAWFLLLFLAAITSSVSMLQPVKAFLREALGCSARAAVLLLGALVATGSFWVLYFSADLVALDTLDFWIGTIAIFVLAGVEVVCFGWVLGIDRGLAEAHQGAMLKIPRIYRLIIKYVAPAYLAAVFIGFCVQSLPEYLHALGKRPVAGMTVGLALITLVALVGMARRAERRALELGDSSSAADRDDSGQGSP
jgi:NSS family neurotransmitter:Na+ symporter